MTDTAQPSHQPPPNTASPGPSDPRTDMDAKLAAEIEDALGDISLEDMLDMADAPKSAPTAGGSRGRGGDRAPAQRQTRGTERQRKSGTIMSIHGNDVFVEFGPKSQGVCPKTMFETTPVLGEKMEFIVDRFDRDDGLLILSREGTVQKAEWESLEVGQVVEARCTGVNKGGLEMEIAQHKAFMPAGQVDLRHIADLSVFVGEKMPCEVTEVDRQRGRIILSRRSALETERVHLRMKLLGTLEIGQVLPAVITSVQNYGAFADLGGLDGLIHISDMSYERIKHPSEIVKEGQQVQVKVLKIDQSQDPPRVGLGLKQTMADPSVAVLEKVKVNEEVTGRITKLMPFGAFVELGPGVEGLIHISELSHDRVHDVKKVVKVDEVVTVKVLNIDPKNKRISLSLKALKSQASAEEMMERREDNRLKKARAQLSKKFGPLNLKGGIG